MASINPDEMKMCARGSRCAERNAEGSPARTPRGFCASDHRIIGSTISAVPDLYVELRSTLLSKAQRGIQPKESSYTKGSFAPAPVRLDLDSLAWELETALTSWTRRVKQTARLSVIVPHRKWGAPAVMVTRFCLVLEGHLDILLALPPEEMTRGIPLARSAIEIEAGHRVVEHRAAGVAEIIRPMSGVDAGLEILTLAYRIRRALGHTPQHQRLPIPCGNCDLMGWLVRWDGGAGFDDGAYCLHCGHEYTLAEYIELADDLYRRSVAKSRLAM